MIDLSFDDSEEVFLPGMIQSHRKAVSKNKAEQKKLLRKQTAEAIIEDCGGIPAAGVFYDILCNGQSNAGGFYEVFRDIWGEVEHLALATWIINREYIEMLFQDIEAGRLKSMTFVISNRMSQLGKGHGPNFNVLKTKAMESPHVNFKVVNSHAKVFAMTNGKDFITVTGSGNWSENPRYENYIISNDRTRYEFHADWMREVQTLKL